MTKEELAKKKGIKLEREKKSPSDALLTTVPVEKKEVSAKGGEEKKAEVRKDREEKTNPVIEKRPDAVEVIKEAAPELLNEVTVVKETMKRGPGKPKKRKEGDKKISFWLDEDLVNGLYGSLSYGESAGELINTAVREYQKNHKTYTP